MALDGAFLRQIKKELEEAVDARVDKIHQVSKEELIFVLRLRGGSRKLYLSAGADSPRIHFTSTSFENPKAPPMFCMLLRKHLSGAKIVEIRQVGLDRVLQIVFETRNEMGDLVRLTGSMEIMGRHSNFILVGKDGTVIDSIKRIDDTMSSVRPVLPGMRYTLPPAQDKLILIDSTPEEIEQRVRQGKDQPLSKAILAAVQGVSPIVCREIANYACLGDDKLPSQMSGDNWDRLRFFVAKVIAAAGTTPACPPASSTPRRSRWIIPLSTSTSTAAPCSPRPTKATASCWTTFTPSGTICSGCATAAPIC